MEYTAVIRTLGMAGDKFQKELDSLINQTIKPKEIIVYIAEGYAIPKETCGLERYVYVKKGMVAQRALNYKEVTTEWMLFLDDDVYLPPDGVEKLFNAIDTHKADVVAPNTFGNYEADKRTKVRNLLMRKSVPFKSDKWCYKVLKSGGFAYNSKPVFDFYWSESNAGPCSLWRKNDFLNIHFEDDIEWLDSSFYALPEDQVMFYKGYLNGLKIGTVFNSGIIHLDASTTVDAAANISEARNKILRILHSEVRNQILFCKKYVIGRNTGAKRLLARLSLFYSLCFRVILASRYMISGDKAMLQTILAAINDAKNYNKYV